MQLESSLGGPGQSISSVELSFNAESAGKVPGRFLGRDVSTASPVFVPFPSVSPAPDFPNLDHASISWSKVATREATNH